MKGETGLRECPHDFPEKAVALALRAGQTGAGHSRRLVYLRHQSHRETCRSRTVLVRGNLAEMGENRRLLKLSRETPNWLMSTGESRSDSSPECSSMNLSVIEFVDYGLEQNGE